MSIWFWDRLISWDRCERHYAYLIALLCAMTGFFILMKPATSPNMPFNFPLLTWGAPMCTFWCILTVIVVTLQIHYQKRDQLKYSEPLKFASQALLMLVLLIYYDGSNVVQRYRFDLFGAKMLYDDALVALDESLLGWLCPRGQLALCLDEHPLIGVTTTFGAITAEILQLMYVSYYLWGNVLGGYLAWKYYIDMIYLNKDNTARNRKMHWRRIQMYLCAWVGGFLLNFIMNMFFPAVSPRIHLSSHYKNPVRGFFLGDWFRGAIAGAAAKTFSAFPSGHCGLSWLVPILAYRMRLKRYTQITAFAALLITMATLILRYHYFVDFLFSSVVIAFSSWFGGFHTQEAYDKCLQDDQDRGSSRKRLPRSRDEDEVGDSDDDDDMVPLMDIKINTRDTITDQSNQSINQSINQSTERSDSIQDSDSPLPSSSAAIVRLTSQSNKV